MNWSSHRVKCKNCGSMVPKYWLNSTDKGHCLICEYPATEYTIKKYQEAFKYHENKRLEEKIKRILRRKPV